MSGEKCQVCNINSVSWAVISGSGKIKVKKQTKDPTPFLVDSLKWRWHWPQAWKKKLKHLTYDPTSFSTVENCPPILTFSEAMSFMYSHLPNEDFFSWTSIFFLLYCLLWMSTNMFYYMSRSINQNISYIYINGWVLRWMWGTKTCDLLVRFFYILISVHNVSWWWWAIMLSSTTE